MRFVVGAALAGALLALPAAAVATPHPFTVSKRVTLDSTGVAETTLRCGGRALALSGYAGSLSGGAQLRDSVPVDIHRWSFRVTGSGSARVGLRCLRLVAPRGFKTVNAQVFTRGRERRVAAGGSASARATCAKGFVPAGFGVDRSEADAPASQLAVASAKPSARGWAVRVENASATTQQVTLRIRCLSSRASGKRNNGTTAHERFSLRRPAFTDTVRRGGTLRHRCARGSFSLAAGHTVRARDDITLPLARPGGQRSGAWTVRNPSGGKEQVGTYLTCLSLSTNFR